MEIGLAEPDPGQHRPDQGDVRGMPVVGSTGEGELEGAQGRAVLLGCKSLKRLGGRPKEEGLVDVAGMSHKGAVGGHNSHRPIVHRLDQT